MRWKHVPAHALALKLKGKTGVEEACDKGLQCLWRREVPTFRWLSVHFYLTALFIIVASLAFATPIALQSFENSASDTWTYTASPASFVPYFWGRTNQAQGGANAQDGSWYWASWLMENNEASLTFSNVAITPGTQHSISFYYYSKNLNPATDQLRICLEYDDGIAWNNWLPLLWDTQDWSLFSINIPPSAATVRVKILTQYSNADMDKYVHWDNFSIKAQEAEYTPPVPPVVFNTSVVQRSDGSKLVDIYYDLLVTNSNNCEIGLTLSENGGNTFNIIPSPANLSGDIGENIAPGFGKHIVWDAGAESRDFDGDQFMACFTAEDGQFPMPENFVFVEGGTFHNGSSNITISSFYIDKYELTNSEWNAVMGSGGGDDYPKNYVSWFNAIEYCNRRSMQEGLTPCYSYSSFGSNPDDWPSGWNTSYDNHTNVSCNWTANGYRLPTEMEWQFAARGGNQTHNYTYSGSNTIGEVAWYSGNSGGTSHTVGTKTANELGIYDMSGNVWEWCWDIYGSYPSGSQTDPHGATSGSYRVRRGGYFSDNANYCTVSYRYYNLATFSNVSIGFRICRVSP